MQLALVLLVTSFVLALYSSCLIWLDRRGCGPDCRLCLLAAGIILHPQEVAA